MKEVLNNKKTTLSSNRCAKVKKYLSAFPKIFQHCIHIRSVAMFIEAFELCFPAHLGRAVQSWASYVVANTFKIVFRLSCIIH